MGCDVLSFTLTLTCATIFEWKKYVYLFLHDDDKMEHIVLGIRSSNKEDGIKKNQEAIERDMTWSMRWGGRIGDRDFLTFYTSPRRDKHTHAHEHINSNGMFCFPMLKIGDNMEGPKPEILDEIFLISCGISYIWNNSDFQ